jgi:hypothetical protein
MTGSPQLHGTTPERLLQWVRRFPQYPRADIQLARNVSILRHSHF